MAEEPAAVSPPAPAAPTTAGRPRRTRLRHDLRTFANIISGYGELVTQDAGELGAASIVTALGEVQRASKLMIESLSAFPWDDETTDAVVLYRPLQSELVAFAGRVIGLVDGVHVEAVHDGGDTLLPDLARIRRAASELETVAGTILDRTAADADDMPDAVTSAVAATADAPAPVTMSGSVLVIDDNDANRDLLARILQREGLEVLRAGSGTQGIEMVESRPFDLILLDLLMADMDGVSVLRRIKRDPDRAHVPVVMLSAVDELPAVVACLEAGAEDYLTKPFNTVLLRSRVRVLLDRKQFQDRERRRTTELEAALAEVERQKGLGEQLLQNILPAMIADELRETGRAEPMYFEDVTIVITDFVGFTEATERLSADELVEVLNQYFTAFDRIVDRYGLEKLKTIGDSYMFASGLPARSASHPVDAGLAALDMLEAVKRMTGHPVDWKVRIGMHTGPVIAGIVGIRKFAFDVWGDTINLAVRMEAASQPNRLNLSERSYARVKDFLTCEPRGRISIKDGRELDMYFANAITPKLLEDTSAYPPPAFAKRYLAYFQKPLKAFPESSPLTTPRVTEVTKS